jgi:hypothetical protein
MHRTITVAGTLPTTSVNMEVRIFYLAYSTWTIIYESTSICANVIPQGLAADYSLFPDEPTQTEFVKNYLHNLHDRQPSPEDIEQCRIEALKFVPVRVFACCDFFSL